MSTYGRRWAEANRKARLLGGMTAEMWRAELARHPEREEADATEPRDADVADEYTPTPDEVRAEYVTNRALRVPTTHPVAAEFDRWLAEERAKVWAEGYSAGVSDAVFDERGLSSDPDADEHPHTNPYREDR